jgi:hypothetical protein
MLRNSDDILKTDLTQYRELRPALVEDCFGLGKKNYSGETHGKRRRLRAKERVIGRGEGIRRRLSVGPYGRKEIRFGGTIIGRDRNSSHFIYFPN